MLEYDVYICNKENPNKYSSVDTYYSLEKAIRKFEMVDRKINYADVTVEGKEIVTTGDVLKYQIPVKFYEEAVVNSFGFGNSFISEEKQKIDWEYISKYLEIDMDDVLYLGRFYNFIDKPKIL